MQGPKNIGPESCIGSLGFDGSVKSEASVSKEVLSSQRRQSSQQSQKQFGFVLYATMAHVFGDLRLMIQAVVRQSADRQSACTITVNRQSAERQSTDRLPIFSLICEFGIITRLKSRKNSFFSEKNYYFLP